jgi:P22 coat protein - gene protein 5
MMQTLVMPAALPVLREACVMPALVATNFAAEAYEQYQTIRVPIPVDLGPAQDMDLVNGSQSTDLKPRKVDIVLDKWKYKQFEMNDKEMRESVTAGVLPKAAEAAIKSLANSIDEGLWALYADVPYFAGTAGVTPNTKDGMVTVRRVMQDNLCPPGDRRMVLDTSAEAEYINLFADWQKTGTTEALVAASLGMKFGFEIFADQLAPMHAFGTFASSTPKVNGAVSPGAIVMNITGGSGAETIKKGDAFTIAGVVDPRGRPRQFVFIEDYVAAGGSANGVKFYPEAPLTGIPDTAAITIVKPAAVGATQYATSMAFHRDAFMFAARSLQTEMSENSTISVAVDPVTGIPLRLETWREPGKSKRIWRFDILFGVRTLRPELSCRFHG